MFSLLDIFIIFYIFMLNKVAYLKSYSNRNYPQYLPSFWLFDLRFKLISLYVAPILLFRALSLLLWASFTFGWNWFFFSFWFPTHLDPHPQHCYSQKVQWIKFPYFQVNILKCGNKHINDHNTGIFKWKNGLSKQFLSSKAMIPQFKKAFFWR